jgi:NhaP-type Na+/H+ or K+/H+ antiporter
MFEIEIKSFHELVIEGTFIVRACFFILFGFLLETKEILNIHTLPYAIFAILLIFTIRYLILRMLKIARYPLVFIAPRGLITVLLFISIPVSRLSSAINNSLIVQIILLSALMLTLGNIISKNKKNDTADETEVKEIAIH